MSEGENISDGGDGRSEDDKQWGRERAEKNRQRALLLRKSKLVAHPYAKE